MSKYLVTGGLGFIGSYIVRNLFEQGHEVHVLDANTYAADATRLEGVKYKLHRYNIIRPLPIGQVSYDYILHLAAETHVDNSISNPRPFVMTNVVGTFNMLEFARKQPNLKAFLYFSTDEVFGVAPGKTLYKEWDRYKSGNPYSATKAGGEELAQAWENTYGLPVITTHTMNVFGPTQHLEKFIPSTVDKVGRGETVIIHGTPDKTKAGSRFYIHAEQVAKAVDFVLEHGKVGEKYNIVGEREVDNLELAKLIAKTVGKPLKHEVVDFHSSRPGHDLRYGLDGSLLESMGWKLSQGTFESDLKSTVESYL